MDLDLDDLLDDNFDDKKAKKKGTKILNKSIKIC